ncbi:MAG: DegV family protein [Anaerolineae bacterium]|nr:MAG: DegV family protein [Anaerolineae bacterium]
MSNVMIVTDSNAHLPPDTAKRLGAQIVPHRIQIGKRIYREGST